MFLKLRKNQVGKCPHNKTTRRRGAERKRSQSIKSNIEEKIEFYV